MSERTASPVVLAVSLLLCWAAAAPCAAQPPATSSVTRHRSQPSLSSLPSAVAPEIASFVTRSGRDLPQPPTPSALNTRNSQRAQDLPGPLPDRAGPTSRALPD